jgi:hypothetical protein
MEYETASSRLHPDISLTNNSFIDDLMANPTNSLAWVLLLKLGVPSFLPYLLLGPAIQLITSFLLHPYTPASVLDRSSGRMKWRTTFIARLSAAITGSCAIWVLYESPSMRADLMLTSSVSAQHLVIFSLGIHLAEAVDMLLHGRPDMLLVHHFLVIICFAGALITEKAVGFAVLSHCH